MTALIIIGIVLLLIAGLLFLRATVFIDYREQVTLSVSVAGIKLALLPRKEKKINIKNFSVKKFRRMLAKKYGYRSCDCN